LTDYVTLAVDAMGGDNAPKMVIEGINCSLTNHEHVKFLVFGDSKELLPLFSKFPQLEKVSEIRHTEDIVTNNDKVAHALRSGRNSSMRLAIDAVSTHEADGIISAGNTGALMAMAKFVLKTLPGITRPAIAAHIPTMIGQSLMLDLGANIACDAKNLVQFAVMGEVLARQVAGLENPSVGILNVGEEDLKGMESVKEAASILQNTSLPIKFHGFIEGDDITAGIVDVIVTDGFTGNIALKTAEGTAKMFGLFLREAFQSSPLAMFGSRLAKRSLLKFKSRLDPRTYNGAMLLGLNGICVKSHGGSDYLGFSNAIGVAINLIRTNLNENIKKDYSRVHDVKN